MSEWGPGLFGDPCRECGYSWRIELDGARGVIAATPDRYSRLCAGRDGHERHPDLSWPVVAYVCHVADNFAIFAERLVGIVRSGRGEVAPYDQDELARVRRYPEVTIEGALWSLEVRAPQLLDAIAIAHRSGAEMIHPERGIFTTLDTARSVAHDAFHHGWDIERSFRHASA